MMKLVNDADGKEIKVGDKLTTFRGEQITIAELFPPKHPWQGGRYAAKEDGPYGPTYYVSTINAHFEDKEETK